MNFYIGYSIKEVEINEYNVELSDNLLDYIYYNRRKFPFDVSALLSIDRYGDVVIKFNQIFELYCISQKLLKDDMCSLNNEYRYMLNGLNDISKKALVEGKNLISIGD